MGISSGSSIKLKSLLDLEPDKTISVYANYPDSDITGATISQGAGTGLLNNTRTYIIKNNRSRIKVSGTIKGLRLKTGTSFTANKGNLVNLFLVIYRKNGTTYDEVKKSIDIATLFKAETNEDTIVQIDFAENDWLTDININDYVALQMVSNGSTISGLFKSKDTSTALWQIFLDGTLGTVGIDFDGLGTGNSAMMIIQPIMTQPWANYIGDSLGEGTPQTQGFYDNEIETVDPTKSICFKLQTKLGRNIMQNSHGEANGIVATLLNAKLDKLTNSKSKVTFVSLGTNDVNASTLQTDFERDYQLIIDEIVKNGSIPIIIGISPRGDLDDTKQQARIDYNKFLKNLANSNNYIFVEMDSELGQRKLGKTQYNEWDILTSFDSGDKIHYTEIGYDKMADKIERAVRNNEDAVSIL